MTAPGSSDWTRQPARPIAAAILAALVLGALPTAFSREPISHVAITDTPDMRIDLNTATLDELVMLPAIGEARARAILVYRATHGPFRSIDALDAVKGFGPRTIDTLRPFLTVSPPTDPAP